MRSAECILPPLLLVVGNTWTQRHARIVFNGFDIAYSLVSIDARTHELIVVRKWICVRNVGRHLFATPRPSQTLSEPDRRYLASPSNSRGRLSIMHINEHARRTASCHYRNRSSPKQACGGPRSAITWQNIFTETIAKTYLRYARLISRSITNFVMRISASSSWVKNSNYCTKEVLKKITSRKVIAEKTYFPMGNEMFS